MLCVRIRLPHQGHSIFNMKKTITLNYSKSAAMGFCSKRLKNEFKTAVVNKPSVFEPLKFYCSRVVSPEGAHIYLKLSWKLSSVRWTTYVMINGK